MFVWWGAQTCALFFATLRSYILARLRSITFKHGNFLTFRCSLQRSWRVHDISWKNDAEGSFTCCIREVKRHVYVKRQTRICTTRLSFLSICRLLFNISTPSLVVELFLSAHFLYFEKLSSWIWRLSYTWSNSLLPPSSLQRPLLNNYQCHAKSQTYRAACSFNSDLPLL